jgi:hypothetical protein
MMKKYLLPKNNRIIEHAGRRREERGGRVISIAAAIRNIPLNKSRQKNKEPFASEGEIAARRKTPANNAGPEIIRISSFDNLTIICRIC